MLGKLIVSEKEIVGTLLDIWIQILIKDMCLFFRGVFKCIYEQLMVQLLRNFLITVMKCICLVTKLFGLC